jgi:Na+/H+ antiporter NhaD/arsenite permease-like protein
MILIIIAIFFVLGYIAIALEHPIKINKAAVALLLGSLLWLIWIKYQEALYGAEGVKGALGQLLLNFEELQILFFLIGAMAIASIIDINDGFSVITSRIKTNNVQVLMWIISWIAFFFSAFLGNLTATIITLTLAHRFVSDTRKRLYFAGIIIIAANAGGAWSPIGDVTTTMLWIGGQISALNIIKTVLLPSIVCLVTPLIVLNFFVKGKVCEEFEQMASKTSKVPAFERNLIFAVGVGGLLTIPVIRTIFHVPPYIAVFFVLGILWIVVEILGSRKYSDKIPERLNIFNALKKIDTASMLFFAGILLAVGVLGTTGQLAKFAVMLEENVSNDIRIIVILIGIFSAIVDNVPLVAASMKMYSLQVFQQDDLLWEFIAYCAGTGGSLLVIGSAAGVAAMGIDRNLTFGWFCKKIAPLAALGYFTGTIAYLIIRGALFN